MTFKTKDVIDRIITFCEVDVIEYRKDLMVRKKFIDESEGYTEDIWNEFKECWLTSPIL